MPDPDDCDRFYAVPWPLRLRTIQAGLLAAALLSLAAALQWPGGWRVIAVGDVALLSVFFALAATREWFLHIGQLRRGLLRRVTAGHYPT